MFETIQQIIAEQMNVAKDRITMDTHLQDDLGADSIDAAEIIIAIESELDIEIPDEVAERIRTVTEIMDFLQEQEA